MSEQPKRLRSALWSSETLNKGMKEIAGQPDGIMAPKSEEESDVELAMEYAVSCSLNNEHLLLYSYTYVFSMCSERLVGY